MKREDPLLDRLEIADLFEKYLSMLDDGSFCESNAGDIFTPDAMFAFPSGTHQGLEGLDTFTDRFMGHWALTHHIVGHCRVDVGRDIATVTQSVLATHVHRDSPPPPKSGNHFQLGGRFDGTARRTAVGWRLCRLDFHVAWTVGVGVPTIAARMTQAHQ